MKISELQQHIKSFDFKPEQSDAYLLKLVEEVGELSRAMRQQPNSNLIDGQVVSQTLTPENIKGSVAEEIYDVLYYACALANVHGVDLENVHAVKDELNRRKYPR